MQWIIEAESDALDIDFQKTIGVPDFNPRDRQTYWNRHDQFNLWYSAVRLSFALDFYNIDFHLLYA